MDSTAQIESPILLFDGVCNLCIGAVNFIIDQEALKHYKFASLQSQFAQRLLREKNYPQPIRRLTQFICLLMIKFFKRVLQCLKLRTPFHGIGDGFTFLVFYL